ncbi:MAG: hypothetical protein HC800_06340 [Phormidesmis sp. RL_2_1]|nr:hypothetical protein [Phormidesmis sp. RL_2_1]
MDASECCQSLGAAVMAEALPVAGIGATGIGTTGIGTTGIGATGIGATGIGTIGASGVSGAPHIGSSPGEAAASLLVIIQAATRWR